MLNAWPVVQEEKIFNGLFEQIWISLSWGWSILTIVRFGTAELEKNIIKHFPIYLYVKV